MIFITCQHYDINKYDYKENETEKHDCFICYENEDREKYKPIKLGTQQKYIRNCSCDVFIHITCLDRWYELNHTCPICRNYIVRNIKKSTLVSFIEMYNYIQNNTWTIYRIIFFFLGCYYFVKRILFMAEMNRIVNYLQDNRNDNCGIYIENNTYF